MSPSKVHAKSVLLVEDEPDTRFAIKLFLSGAGYLVDSVASAEEALRVFDPELHHAVLTDNSLPGMTGVEMARRIKLTSPSTPVIMHTGSPPEDCSSVDIVLQNQFLFSRLNRLWIQ